MYRPSDFLLKCYRRKEAEHDATESLTCNVQLDDAYPGDENLGTGGRGAANKVPIVAAVQTNDSGHPLRLKVTPVLTLSREAIAHWARANLMLGSDVHSDGLACFAGVTDAGCAHSYIVVASRKPRDLPQFTWGNTILGNLKTKINGAHKAFKYARQYLGAFAYRFSLADLLRNPLSHAALTVPTRERQIRRGAESRD